MDKKMETRIHELVFKSVESIITEDECRELESIIGNDIKAREIYSKCIKLNLRMLCLNGEHFSSSDLSMLLPDPTEAKDCDEIDLCSDVLKVLSETEKAAPSVEVFQEKVEQPETVIDKPNKPVKTNKLFRIYSVIVSIAAVFMFLFVVYANFFPPQYSVEVATIADQLDVIWSKDSKILESNDRILTNQPPYKIEQGIVKIVFDRGVDVLIEGPAEFEIDRSGVFLDHGRLYSIVSDTGIGFSVESPFTRFVDLGTEFGVEIDENGSSSLHVIDGKVQFYAGIIGENTVSKTVCEYNALSFDSQSGRVNTIPFKEEVFARNIYSATGSIWRGQRKISLADIVGGGNGFGTGEINRGINNRGKFDLLDDVGALEKVNSFLYLKDIQFIDSIFVPNGATKIDSADNIYPDFEPTNDKFCLGILNGAWHQHRDGSVPRHALRLNNIEYGSIEHPAIYIHANQGITFDLQAIQHYTQMKVNKFTAICGLSDSYGDYTAKILKVRKRVVNEPKASFYILVDGQERFVLQDTTYKHDPTVISIDISSEDRFLTLATTQGSGSSNEGDWTLFAEPFLELLK